MSLHAMHLAWYAHESIHMLMPKSSVTCAQVYADLAEAVFFEKAFQARGGDIQAGVDNLLNSIENDWPHGLGSREGV